MGTSCKRHGFPPIAYSKMCSSARDSVTYLVEANAIGNFATLTVAALAATLVFVGRQSIDWTMGGFMAFGSLAGGALGGRLAISRQARRWIVMLRVVVIVCELLHLAVPIRWLDNQGVPAIDAFCGRCWRR
jgi:uncharacterized protein